MAAASAVRVSIQILVLPVIGRLLGPEAYGQVALVSPFIFFSMLLAESGLGACIVRAEETSAALEGTVFCFSAAFSAAFVALFAILAYPLGHLMGRHSFPPLLMGMSSILLLAALNVVPAARLLRAKKYKWIAASDVASCLGGVAALVAGVLLGWGAWSLVAQQLAFWGCKVAVVTASSRWRPRFIFRWELIRQNIYFGSNLTGASILSFISRNIDNLLIGVFLGTEALGHYALAFQIVGLPQMVLSGSIYYTVFSGTSEAKRDGTFSPARFLNVLRGVLLISAPAMIGMAVTAPLSVPLILGDKWMPTAYLIMLLTPLSLCQSMGAATSGMMIGLGRSDVTFRLGMIGAAMTVAAILAGVALGSSSAVAAGVSATSLIGAFLVLRFIVRECGTSFAAIGRAVAIPLISAVIMGCAVFALQSFMPESLMAAARLAISIIAGVLLYGLILFGLFRDQIATDVATISNAVMRIREKQ